MATRKLTPEEVDVVSGGSLSREHEPPGQDRREEVGNRCKVEPPGQEKKDDHG
jgi:hypothetical protein